MATFPKPDGAFVASIAMYHDNLVGDHVDKAFSVLALTASSQACRAAAGNRR